MLSIQRISKMCLIAVLFVCSCFQVAISQSYIDVAPGYGTLTDAINANTDSTVIFRLQRGATALYLLNGSISNTIPLRIEAVSGTGALPQLIPAVPSGGASVIPFAIKANLTLKGVYVTGKDQLGAYLSQIIRLKADNIRLVLDSCFLENSAQAAIRTDNKGSKIYLKKTTIRNCASDYTNGRGIDDRGVDMDTLSVVDCTIYNLGSRFLRDGGGVLNYAYVNHNTFANMGLEVMQFGECPKVIFKNNLVVNCGFLGHGVNGTDALLQLNPLTSTVYTGVQQSVEVHHNNFVIDASILQKFPDTVVANPPYNAQMQAMITASSSDTSGTISERVIFTKEPNAVNNLVTQMWSDPLGTSSTTATGLRGDSTYSFSYPTSARSYTGGTLSQPLGALTWFGLTTSVKTQTGVPADFSLCQNYPNPFNPTTKISYTISKASSVHLSVFNILGQMVKVLANRVQPAGTYSVEWDGTSQSGQKLASGIYFYKLSAGENTSMKKMVMLK